MTRVQGPSPGATVEVLLGAGSGLEERAGTYVGEVELSPLGEPIGFVELFAAGKCRPRWSPRRRDEEAHAKEALYELVAMEAEVHGEPAFGLHDLDLEIDPREDAPAEEEMGPVSVEAVSEFFDQQEQHLARLVEDYSAGLSKRHRRAHLLAGLGALCLGGFAVGFPHLAGDTTPLETVANLVPFFCGGALVASVELRLFSGEDKASRQRKRIEEARVMIATDNGRVCLGLLVENPAKTRR